MRLSYLQTFTPVVSHQSVSGVLPPAAPSPGVGSRWGKPASFTFEDPSEQAGGDLAGGGGVVVRWPEESRRTVKVTGVTPVWTRYEVWRIPSDSDPDTTMDVRVVKEVLLPIRSETQNYVGGGSYARGMPGEPRVIHTFLKLSIPVPDLEGEKVDGGTEGAWPSYPTEMFPPRRSGITLTRKAGLDGMGWDR